MAKFDIQETTNDVLKNVKKVDFHRSKKLIVVTYVETGKTIVSNAFAYGINKATFAKYWSSTTDWISKCIRKNGLYVIYSQR